VPPNKLFDTYAQGGPRRKRCADQWAPVNSVRPYIRAKFWIVAPVLLSSICIAQPDEEVIHAMTRGTNLKAEEIRRDYDACDNGTTSSMKICGAYRFTKQDLRMNRLYKAALSESKKLGYQADLVRAQRAWVAYRDAACDFEGRIGAGGGTAEGLYVLSCKEQLSAQRADRLEEFDSKEAR
jgi:uncharacterized protein YecT (DUF1311 family)